MAKQVTFPDKVENSGATDDGKVSASNINELKSAINANRLSAPNIDPQRVYEEGELVYAEGSTWRISSSGADAGDLPSTHPDKFESVDGKKIANPVLFVANSIARKTLASYDPDGVIVGVTRVIQSDLIGVIWVLVAADVTLDTSWLAMPYSTEPDGTIVVNMELADMSSTIPDKHVLGQVGGLLTIGDNNSVGGRRIAMSPDIVDGYIFFTSVSTTDIDMEVQQDGVDGATGVCYSIDGGAPVFSATDTFTIPHNNGAPFSVALWAASSATSGRKGDITYFKAGNTSYGGLPCDFVSLDTRGSKATNVVLIKPKLNTINLDSNTALSDFTLYVGAGYADTLILSNCPLLTVVQIEYAVNITDIDVSGNPLLARLRASHSGLKSLDVSNNPDIYVLEVDNSQLEVLDISGVNTGSQGVMAKNNKLTKIIAVGHTPTHFYHDHYLYDDFSNNLLTTDAVYDFLDDVNVADYATCIELAGNPCTEGGYLHEGVTRTAAETEALAATKNLTLIYN